MDMKFSDPFYLQEAFCSNFLGLPALVAVNWGRTSPIRNNSRIGRNDLCPCGSGLKHKFCCGGSKKEKISTLEIQELTNLISLD